MDVLSVFGDVSEEIINTQKYAKWKATTIHNCLKNGETPTPGPPATEGGPIGFNLPSQEDNTQQPSKFDSTPADPTSQTCNSYLPLKYKLKKRVVN